MSAWRNLNRTESMLTGSAPNPKVLTRSDSQGGWDRVGAGSNPVALNLFFTLRLHFATAGA